MPATRAEPSAVVGRYLSRNETVGEVLERARALDLPGWYLTAGAVFQTVWNGLTERPPNHGIRDYAVFYHDATDLTWEAEDRVIQRAADAFQRGSCAPRYEEKFGVPCPPYASTEAHAPHGYDDLLGLVLRPNRVLAPREGT